MREESNRIIQGMERRRRAEKEQADKNLQAMGENAAYTERAIKQNREIALQNLKNESMQKLVDIQGAQKQAQTNAAATESIIDSIVGFSKTAAKVAAERTAKMIKDQTAIGLSSAAQSISTEAFEQYTDAKQLLLTGGIALDADVAANGVLNNEDPYETYKGYISNHGFKGYAAQANDNKVAVQLYNQVLNKRLQSADKTFIGANGEKFSGVEALSNPELLAQLQQQTRKDVSAYMGFTDPMYLSEANKAIDESDKAQRESASKEGIKQAKELIRQQAFDIAGTGTVEGVTGAFARIKISEGVAAAHDWYQENVIANPYISEAVAGAPDLLDNGKSYAEQWPGRWEAGIKKRLQAYVKQVDADEALKKAADNAWVDANIDSIQQAYDENPEQAAVLVKQRYHGKGMTVPPVIAAIEREAIKKKKDIVENTIDEKTRFGNLDLTFVNSIQDLSLQKKARAAYEQQELNKYGPEALGIKKGFKATARKLTEIDPNENQGSPLTFLVQARLESEYLKQLKITNDPLKALEEVNKMVDAGQDGDDKSPFYMDPAQGALNRPVFPNIASSDREVAEMMTSIDKQIRESGEAVVSKPFSLATSIQMDATYTSAVAGAIQYPPGIIKFAEQFNLKPSEVYNSQRQANNAKTGANKPLLTPSPVTDLIDSAPPAMRKLFLSDVNSQIRRGGAMFTGQLPIRFSMPGGSPFQPLRKFAPQVSSVTFDRGQPGIDIFFEDKNFPAVLPGVVKDIGYQVNADGSGYGNYLVIESIDPITNEPVDVLYSHFPNKPSQSIGQYVSLGEIIGKQGGTGSVQSADGTISSIDFLAPAARGSGSMTPYSNYESLRERIANQLQ
jgi:hypothetical protein